MALTLQGRELTDSHRIAQAEVAAKWVSLGSVLTTELLDPAAIDRTAPTWFGAITVLVNQAMAESQALAAAYVPAFRSVELGGEAAELLPLELDDIDPSPALHRVSLLPPMALKQIAEEKPAQEAIDETFWRLAGALQRDFLNVGREVVVGSAEASPVSRWRRVTDGNPCAFCGMLAGRGPVYSSPATAGFVSGRNLSGSDYRKMRRLGDDSGKMRVSIVGGSRKGRGGRRGRATKQPLGARYHNHCGCSVEEVLGPWDPTPQERALKDLYDAVHEPGDTLEQTLTKMRAQGQDVVRDATKPETKAGGAGGSGGRRLPPVGPPPDPSDRDAWRTYWMGRQQRIPFDFKDETLEPHEVIFAERFWEAGQTAEWIPRSKERHPTNDFQWLEKGLPVELKHTKPRYETIHGRIVGAASKAAKQGAVKENFMIDLGDEVLSDELRDRLRGFNVGRQKYRAKHIWVMSKGAIEEIRLK